MDDFRPARWGGPGGKKSVQAVPTRSTPPADTQATLIETEPETDTGPDATDAAKALAAEHAIELDTIEGSGLDGRITKEDVAALVPAEPETEGESAGDDAGSTGDDG